MPQPAAPPRSAGRAWSAVGQRGAVTFELYAYTVKVVAWQMRSRGSRVPGLTLRRTPGTSGWLAFIPDILDGHERGMRAQLLAGRGGRDLLHPLRDARIRRLDGVIHITGHELVARTTKGKAERWAQSWLCVLDPADAAPILARVFVDVFGFSDETDDDEPPPNF